MSIVVQHLGVEEDQLGDLLGDPAVLVQRLILSVDTNDPFRCMPTHRLSAYPRTGALYPENRQGRKP